MLGEITLVFALVACGTGDQGSAGVAGGLAGLEPQPTLLAVRMRDAERLQELLQQGVDPDDTQGRAQRRALAEAVTLKDSRYAELLVEYGADVTYAPYHDWTYLHGAAEYGSAGVVGLLLKVGVDPCVRIADTMSPMERRHLPDDVRGMTALDIAKAVHNQEVIELLEEASAQCG